MIQDKALWERRLYPHRREHAGKRRGARRATWNHKRAEVLILVRDAPTALPTAKLGSGRGVDIATTSLGWKQGRQKAWP